MPSPDRFRKLDGLGWLTTAAAAVAGGCAWLFSPFLVSPFLQDFTFHGKLGPAWLTWVLVLSAFGASILLHEAGHCLAARYLGLPISQIRVSILRGTGSVEIDAELDRREEMWVTLAGPLANLAGFFLIFALPLVADRTLAGLLLHLSMTNAGTCVMNLMPFRFDDHTVSDGERLLAIFFQD